MAVIIKGVSFDPCPEGQHQAVCCDVLDLGMKQGQNGPYQAVEIRWQVDLVNPKTGKRFLVVQQFGASLTRRSNLGKLLRAWRGRDFTPEEFESFDLETVLGANCVLNILQETKEGMTYANIHGVMPLLKGVAKLEAENYTRVSERPDRNEPPTDDDDSIPF